MFAALLIKPPPIGFKNKIREFFVRSKPRSDMVRLKNGAYFFNITMPLKKGGIDWAELGRTANIYADKILMPCDISPPPDSGITRLSPQQIIPRAVISTCVKIFSRQKIIFDEIAVIDKNGSAANDIIRLVPFCKTLCVITDKPSAYFKTSDAILDEYGVAILISDTPILRGEKCAVIAPDGIFSYSVPHNAIIITGHKAANTARPGYIRCAVLNACEDYLALLPEGIDQNDFIAALYEFAAAKDGENSYYKTVISSGKEVATEEIIL